MDPPAKSSEGSELARVLARSLDMDYTIGEFFSWSDDAKQVRKLFEDLKSEVKSIDLGGVTDTTLRDKYAAIMQQIDALADDRVASDADSRADYKQRIEEQIEAAKKLKKDIEDSVQVAVDRQDMAACRRKIKELPTEVGAVPDVKTNRPLSDYLKGFESRLADLDKRLDLGKPLTPGQRKSELEIGFNELKARYDKAASQVVKEVPKPVVTQQVAQDHEAPEIAAARQQRDEFVQQMNERMIALLDREIKINPGDFLKRRSALGKKWRKLNDATVQETSIKKIAELIRDVKLEFEELDKEANTIEEERISRIAELEADYEAIDGNLERVVRILKVKDPGNQIGSHASSLQKLRKKSLDDWSLKNFEQAESWTDSLKKEIAKTLRELADSHDEGGLTLSFGGEKVADVPALVKKIKDELPQNGHGDISQALNDVLLGRGKATTDRPGVLHASAGKTDAKGGCTLFFARDAKGNVDVVGVGQHKTSTSYDIYFGLDLEGKVLSL